MMRDKRWLLFVIAALVVAADRWSKMWVNTHILPGRAIPIIPNPPRPGSFIMLRLTHVLNNGAAFSLFEGAKNPDIVRYALITFSTIAVLAVTVMLWRFGRSLSMVAVSLALILGGALGNLYDRAVLHVVIDFIEVHIRGYHWPDFNVADSAIVVGACVLLLEMLRPQKREM